MDQSDRLRSQGGELDRDGRGDLERKGTGILYIKIIHVVLVHYVLCRHRLCVISGIIDFPPTCWYSYIYVL